jgi:hypothetical protein
VTVQCRAEKLVDHPCGSAHFDGFRDVFSTDGRSIGSYLAAAWILTVFNQQRANCVPDSRLVHFRGSHLILLGRE